MLKTTIKLPRISHIRSPRQCGMNDELLWLERKARAELRPADDGARAISLAQISLQLSQLRRHHFDACDTCGEQPWIG